MSRVMAFFKTRTGAAVLFLIGMFVVFYFIREYRERNGQAEKPVVAEGEKLLGQMSPEENKPEPDKPVTSEWVAENKLSKFRPPAPATRNTVSPAKTTASKAPKKISLPKLVHFFDAPKEKPATPSEAEPPRVFAPTGTLIPCQLIITVDSSSLQTPVVGFVTEDVWHNGNLIVPAGTEVHAFAKRGRVRDRVEVTGTWEFVWQDGRQVKMKGIALDRQHDPGKDSYGLTDGSAGIRGKIAKSDEFLEFKLFAATMFGGAARASEDTTETIFGTRPRNSLEDAGLEGISNVAERYARLLLDQIEGDGLFVRVPAGTEFYIYTLQVFEPELASVAGLEQGEHPRNSWEPEYASAVDESAAPTQLATSASPNRHDRLLKQVAAHQNSKQEKRP